MGSFLLIFYIVILVIISSNLEQVQSGRVIYSINAGGEAHTDSNGITYQTDNCREGIASDFGKRLLIGRVPQKDQILYQTERYSTTTFGYDLPIVEDGDYVLVLKFCEVYFESPDQKVFDVLLNKQHTIVTDLDIYSKVDKGIAHDEYISFEVKDGKILINGEKSTIENGKARLEFIKGPKDNPKINAFYLWYGTIDEIPQLPPLETSEPHSYPKMNFEEEEEPENIETKARIVPKIVEELETEESSIMLPLFIVVAAFIPVLFCLCKI